MDENCFYHDRQSFGLVWSMMEKKKKNKKERRRKKEKKYRTRGKSVRSKLRRHGTTTTIPVDKFYENVGENSDRIGDIN